MLSRALGSEVYEQLEQQLSELTMPHLGHVQQTSVLG